jgi:tetratricopeptide (TPR) repeat protein
MLGKSRALIVVAVLLGTNRPVAADEGSAARKAFLSGMKHFDLAEYRDALNDFRDGYRAKEDPVFLYNIAQCYRALGEQKDALRYYRLYLNRSPDARNRSEVEEKISSLQSAIAAADERSARQSERSTPVASTGKPTAPAPVVTSQNSAAVAPERTDLTVRATAKPASVPVYKRWWLWTIVGGVAAAGAGLGIGLAVTQSNKVSGTTFPTGAF